MSRKLAAKRATIFVAALFVVLTILDYVIGTSSGAMEFAESQVRNSAVLRENIGSVKGVTLRKLWGYAYQAGYGNSSARLNLIVVGERRTLRMEIKLQQVEGQWTVAESSVPL